MYYILVMHTCNFSSTHSSVEQTGAIVSDEGGIQDVVVTEDLRN